MLVELDDYKHSIEKRFIEYAKIDTQSDPFSKSYPSTEKQKNLGKILVLQLLEFGLVDAHMDQYGYVIGTLESNTTSKDVPTICFCSHMDTSPDCSGTDVIPIVHRNYQGERLVLPDDQSQMLNVDDHTNLSKQIGHDIITASGLTLLGADDKAGITAIMTMVSYLTKNPKIEHGTIKILFTPDEEVGHGVDKLDMDTVNADFGYTVDGGLLGTYEDETFSADNLKVIIHGVPAHTGYAKGVMQNALKFASEVIAKLPVDTLSPESTNGLEGFVHPLHINGNAEKVEIDFLLRDFDANNLDQKEAIILEAIDKVQKNYNKSSVELKRINQYRNTLEVLVNFPTVAENARLAILESDLTPLKNPIRGGTDGSKLSFMGMPCVNIFAGEHNIHSKLEYVSVQDMRKSAEVLIRIANIWTRQQS